MNALRAGVSRAITDTQIESEILASLARRAAASSSCPSEVARALVGEGQLWRALMPRIRDVTANLARQDRVVVTRGSRTLSADNLDGGAIRIRRGKRFEIKTEK